jgi:RNA polymerase sigma-70 factor, ECF subfamily
MTIRPPVPSEAKPDDVAQRDEVELVAALRRGDQDAFASLVRVQGRPLLATLRRMLGDEHDARDCLQEAFLSAFRSLATFECKSRLGTWLHRIAVNAALMRLRARRSRPEVPIDELVPTFAPDGHHALAPRAWDEEAIDLLARRESRDLLRGAIDRLPDGYREVVVLRDIEGLCTEQTAEVLGITPNATKIRLHRARQALRTLLDRHFRNDTP